MINSSKLSDSSRFLKTSLINSNDETVSDTNKTFLYPKITSTPLNSIFATPPKNQIMTPRRYSLSEVATPPRNSRREYIRSNSSQYSPGPLLASTKFNVNVSTFEDAKSPGLVNRIVQYNEEIERQKEQRHPATHQAKYGTVGLFPVVHLFKNKLPTLEKKPRHVTVRVASPDYIKHTPEYNKKLLEGLVKPSGGSQGLSHSSHSENSTSTRSVLDALKEISRKRIHANEELELTEDTGKRLRTDSEECTDSNKRLRDESPVLETSISPTKPASKKICMYDEYAASRSSMDFVIKSPESTQPKRKSISISTLTENPKELKQIKLINAETQTAEEEPKKTEVKLTNTSENLEESNETNKPKKVTVLKVFDDAPLERIRRNRLAALIGTLVGKEPVLEPKPDYATLLRGTADNPLGQESADKNDKQLVSILSPTHKSSNKTDKHVTFDIPESISQNNSTITITSSASSITDISVNTDAENKKVESLTSTPSVVTDAESTKPSFSFDALTNKSPTFSSPTTIPTFGNINTTATPILFTPKSLTTDIPKSIPSFNFGGNKPVPSSPISTSKSVVTSSPPKIGGFKFDLAKSTIAPTSSTSNTANLTFGLQTGVSSSNVTTSVSVFSSPITSASVAPSTKVEVSTSGPAFADPSSSVTLPFNTFATSTVASNKPSFSFGSPATSTSTSSTFTFEKVPSAATFGKTPEVSTGASSTTFTFGKASSEAGITTTTGTTFAFAKTPAEAATSSTIFGITSSGTGGFNTVTTSAKTSFSTLTSVANKGLITSPSITSSFGTSSAVPAFGGGNFGNNASFQSQVKSDTGIGFGVSTTASSGFGSNTPGFGISTTTGGFGTTPAFGTTAATPAFGATTAAPGFGTTTATPGFGTTTANPGFGVTVTTGFGTTKASGFGNTINPGFGNSTAPGFGTITTTSSGFGSSVTAASNIFGTPSTNSTGFGSGTFASPVTLGSSPFGTAPTVSSGFGVQTTSTGGFGISTTNPTGFGPATTSSFNFGPSTTTANTGFGAVTTAITPGFGTTTASGFGPNQGSIFASSIPSFGGSSTPSFGSTSSGSSFTETPFGAPATSTSAFGTVTTTSSFNYGGTSKLFGGVNKSFGIPSTTTSSIFGPTQSPFGSGAATTSATALPFTFTGKTTASSTFPATNTTTPSFGSNFGQANTGFGAQSAGFGTPNKASTFGNATPAFGSNTAAPGFGSTTQQTQPFGSTGSVFNKPQPPPQNAFGSSQFNFNQQPNNPSQTSVFAFGSGANEKPGGFNFSAAASGETPKKFDFTSGNTAPPAFGATFGNTPVVPTFGAVGTAPTGNFSIGAGPPASSRPRAQIKAKRRT